MHYEIVNCSHITNVAPTPPEACNMMLGTAYISFNSMHRMLVGGCVSYPVPIIRLKIRNTALGVPVGNSKQNYAYIDQVDVSLVDNDYQPAGRASIGAAALLSSLLCGSTEP